MKGNYYTYYACMQMAKAKHIKGSKKHITGGFFYHDFHAHGKQHKRKKANNKQKKEKQVSFMQVKTRSTSANKCCYAPSSVSSLIWATC